MNPLFLGLLIWLIYLLGMFAIVHIKKDTSLGNFTWGPGCLILALYSYYIYGISLQRQFIVTLLIFLWCIRLTTYVFVRYKRGADPRYVAWLEQWHNPLVAFLFSFGWVVCLNGFFSLVMALPALAINMNPVQPNLMSLDILGIIVWASGFIIESLSDYQLYTFMHNPINSGHICQAGLWYYSRHPNYFGEILMWWGVYMLALQVPPYGWLTIVTPIAITTTLVFVTGIPWVEKAMENNPEYKAYKQTTSMLIPWFKK